MCIRDSTESAVREAVEAELDRAEPLRDNAFKVPLARNLACDVLNSLARGARS